jgi:hypothetical protein
MSYHITNKHVTIQYDVSNHQGRRQDEIEWLNSFNWMKIIHQN